MSTDTKIEIIKKLAERAIGKEGEREAMLHAILVVCESEEKGLNLTLTRGGYQPDNGLLSNPPGEE